MCFKRLFELDENKLSTVAVMCALGWGEGVWPNVGGGGCGPRRRACWESM